MATKSPEPTDKHVGSRVRMRRLLLGVTQGRLADALGVTFQQVQKYEKGTNRISASRLQQISEFLEAPVPFFFEGLPRASNETNKSPADTFLTDLPRFLATSDALSLINAYTRIESRNIRHAIVDLVEGLAGVDY